MSYAEFRIRMHHFNNAEKQRLNELRKLLFTISWSANMDPKKMAKREQAFMPFPWDEGPKLVGPEGVAKYMKKWHEFHRLQREGRKFDD